MAVSVSLPRPVFAQTALAGDAELFYDAPLLNTLLDTLMPIPGVRDDDDLRVTQRAAGANWSIDVSAGAAFVPGAPGEKYFVSSAEPVNINLAGLNTAPPALRRHAVYLTVFDKARQGDRYGADLVVTEDIGNGAPLPPAGYIGLLPLGTFTISPGQTSVLSSHITATATRAAAGQARIACGVRTFTVPNGSLSAGPFRVDLPAGRFTAVPVVTLTQFGLPAGGGYLLHKMTNATAAGFDIWTYAVEPERPVSPAVTVNVNWIAMQEV